MTTTPSNETPDARRARVLREFERCSASPGLFGAETFEALAAELDAEAGEAPALASKLRARAEECRGHASSARARGMAVAQGSEGAPAWTPVVIAGGGKRAAEPPLTWWHLDPRAHFDLGQAAEVVIVLWRDSSPTFSGYRGSSLMVTESGLVLLAGHRPDEITLRELAEDVERWHAEREQDPAHHLESARWGARYHA